MASWIGCKEADGSHMKIIDVYNQHKPLAKGYVVKRWDAWCATAVSAAFIQAGLTDIAPTECSCPRMITLYKQMGRWQENDGYVPKTGDIIMYNWGDNGIGDNQGTANHVGIVVSVSGSTIRVIEGNMNNAVGYRTIQVNGRYIRGYCLPNYASKAAAGASEEKPKAPATSATEEKKPSSANTAPQTVKPEPARKFDRVYAKTYTVTASALNMRRGPGTTKKILKVLKQGEKVTCYGYYTMSGITPWLFVQTSDGQTGYCSIKYLRS